MFDLEREIDAWCRSAAAKRCRPAARTDELKDHFHCEVERLQGEGRTAEEAFRETVAQLETNDTLGLIAPKYTKGEQRMRQAHAVIWAVLMIATAAILRNSNADAGTGNYLLIVVFIPLWYAADQLLARALRKRREA